MNRKLINNFKKFDKKIINLNKKEVIELWFCIRYAVFYNCISPKYFKNKKKNFLEYFKKLVIQIIHSIKIIFFLYKRREIIEIDVGRYKLYDKKLNSTVNHILTKNNIRFQTISLSANSKIFDNKINIIFLVNITYFFLKIFKRFKGKDLKNLSLIEKNFNLFFKNNKKVVFLNIYKSIYLQQLAIFYVIKIFISLFRSKKILYMETANLNKLIQYCGKKSIQTFDIQHSLISNLNILYKFYISRSYNYLITKNIIIWGRYWKKFYSNNNRCINIGYLENKIQTNKILKKKQIMIISSIYSRKYLIELLKFLSSNLKNYKIIYKLRPEENIDKIKSFINFKNKNIVFLGKLSENLLKQKIAQSEYVIGINSTLLIESIGISNIIVYKKDWYKEYEYLIKKNVFLSAKNCIEILSIIYNKKKAANKIKREEIFKKPKINSLRNLLNKI